MKLVVWSRGMVGALPVMLGSVVGPNVESCPGIQWGVEVFVLVAFSMVPVNFDWELFYFVSDIPDQVKVRCRGFWVPGLGDCQHCPLSV